MARTLNSAALSSMASALIQEQSKAVAFVTATPKAATKYSEPMAIVACHFNEATREIRCVGEDTNVRVCKVDRLESIEAARQLWTLLVGCKNSGTIVSFAAAGGFNPNRWFYTVVEG